MRNHNSNWTADGLPWSEKAIVAKITIYDERLSKFQKIHALLLLFVPFLGSLVAVSLAFENGVNYFNLLMLVFLYIITLLGISVGFHRMLAHRTFLPSRYLKIIMSIFGSLAAQGPPIYWVANHRRHHHNSDSLGDPHSPHCINGKRNNSALRGFLHAQIFWTFTHGITNTVRYTKDLMRDNDVVWVSQRYLYWVFLGLLVPFIVGSVATGTFYGGIEGFLWGGLVRLFLSYHATNSINSLGHLFGFRSFQTNDKSTNIFWTSLFTVGESWHNNHHASPASAQFGLRWWQFDPGYWFIVASKYCHLVSEVKLAEHNLIADKIDE